MGQPNASTAERAIHEALHMVAHLPSRSTARDARFMATQPARIQPMGSHHRQHDGIHPRTSRTAARQQENQGGLFICTTPDCERPTETYLCTQCVSDLQAWIDQVPEMRKQLFITMARLDNVRPPNSEGGGGGSAGSSIPLDERAMDMRYALKFWQGHDAAALANDPLAGGFMPDLKHILARAERIIDLPPDIRIITTCQCGGTITSKEPPPTPTDKNPDPADVGTCQTCGVSVSTTNAETVQRIIKGAPDAMKTKDIVKWIRERSGHRIASTDIRNWAREGAIKRANDIEDGHPTYKVQDVLRITYAKLASGKGRKLT